MGCWLPLPPQAWELISTTIQLCRSEDCCQNRALIFIVFLEQQGCCYKCSGRENREAKKRFQGILKTGSSMQIAWRARQDPEESDTQGTCEPLFGSRPHHLAPPPPVSPGTGRGRPLREKGTLGQLPPRKAPGKPHCAGGNTVPKRKDRPAEKPGDAFLPRDVCPLPSKLLPALPPQSGGSETRTQRRQRGRKSEGKEGP